MPKTKRFKKISLTQTDAKGRESKAKLMEDVQSAADVYEHAYLFLVDNMRNAKLKDVRTEWSTSR